MNAKWRSLCHKTAHHGHSTRCADCGASYISSSLYHTAPAGLLKAMRLGTAASGDSWDFSQPKTKKSPLSGLRLARSKNTTTTNNNTAAATHKRRNARASSQPVPLRRVLTAKDYHSDDSAEDADLYRIRYAPAQQHGEASNRYTTMQRGTAAVFNSWGDDDSSVEPQWRDEEEPLRRLDSHEDSRDWIAEEDEMEQDDDHSGARTRDILSGGRQQQDVRRLPSLMDASESGSESAEIQPTLKPENRGHYRKKKVESNRIKRPPSTPRSNATKNTSPRHQASPPEDGKPPGTSLSKLLGTRRKVPANKEARPKATRATSQIPSGTAVAAGVTLGGVAPGHVGNDGLSSISPFEGPQKSETSELLSEEESFRQSEKSTVIRQATFEVESRQSRTPSAGEQTKSMPVFVEKNGTRTIVSKATSRSATELKCQTASETQSALETIGKSPKRKGSFRRRLGQLVKRNKPKKDTDMAKEREIVEPIEYTMDPPFQKNLRRVLDDTLVDPIDIQEHFEEQLESEIAPALVDQPATNTATVEKNSEAQPAEKEPNVPDFCTAIADCLAAFHIENSADRNPNIKTINHSTMAKDGSLLDGAMDVDRAAAIARRKRRRAPVPIQSITYQAEPVEEDGVSIASSVSLSAAFQTLPNARAQAAREDLNTTTRFVKKRSLLGLMRRERSNKG